MEFQNELLRVDGTLASYTADLLTPGSGPARALQTVLEELDELVNPQSPPRWLLLVDDDAELLVHLAEPMFTARGYDADEFMDDAEDEFVYVDSHGDAYLRTEDAEYEVDDPQVAEVVAYLCEGGDLLADFVWFGQVPERVVFDMMMEDAADAYHGKLASYSGT